MGVVDFLKKIGVVKTGSTAGTYKNAKERPDEFVKQDLKDGAESQVSDNIDHEN